MEYLRLAVQKKGRLSEKTLDLIAKCGILINGGTSTLKSAAINFPVELLYLRDDDIPEYVSNGVADIGIVGMNEVEEKNRNVDIIEKLGFSKCRLSIAISNNMEYTSIKSLSNLTIATSYPRILEKYLKRNSVVADIHVISGSVEIAPTLGMADAICDIVSTGSTLLSNGLKEVEKIYDSTAVLIKNPNLNSEKKNILEQLQLRIKSVLKAKRSKYILLNAPNDKLDAISNLLPGMKSPTIQALTKKGWSSLQSVIEENKFWEIIEELKKMGAEGILIVPIENMIC